MAYQLTTLSDILTECRRRFAEIAFTSWIPDSDITAWANLAQYDIVYRVCPPSHEVWPPSSILLVPNTYNYSLPSDFFRFSELEGARSGVFYKGIGLDFISRRKQLEDWIANGGGTNDPESFWLWGNQIFFWPVPGDTGFNARMYYIRLPIDMETGTDPVDLNPPWREVLVLFILWKALEKDKNAMAQVYRQEYESYLARFYAESRVRNEQRSRSVHVSEGDN